MNPTPAQATGDAEGTADGSVDSSANSTVDSRVDGSASSSASNTANNTAEGTAGSTADKTATNTATNTADSTTNTTANNTASNATNNARNKTGENPSETPSESTAEVIADSVNVVFGDDPKRALAAMDAGQSREEIREATGQVLGVHNASFTLHKREIFVLMGLSGSGKSTLLRAVNGLAPVVRGEMRVRSGDAGLVSATHAKGAPLRALRGKAVAMVFQQFGLLPWRSVLENVALGLELSGVPREERRRRAGEQLELVGLSGTANLRVDSLSGGMQQRVGLARAFVTNAPILLMDEPFFRPRPIDSRQTTRRVVGAARPTATQYSIRLP